VRSFTDFFFINGKPMFAPDDQEDISFADLDDSDSGRDEGGMMHRIVVRYKVGTWSFEYAYLTEEEKRYMESLFPDAPDFEFTHPDRLRDDLLVTSRCYRSNYGIGWKNAKTGLWCNYKFHIIEC